MEKIRERKGRCYYVSIIKSDQSKETPHLAGVRIGFKPRTLIGTFSNQANYKQQLESEPKDICRKKRDILFIFHSRMQCAVTATCLQIQEANVQWAVVV